MPVIPWLYGTPISGVQFPMVTASGTYAAGYTPGTMSAVISKDGGAWESLSGRISGIPGGGVYTLVSLSSSEMTCYTWFIKITANSGCVEQGILGINGSGPALATTVSGFATKDSVSGLPGMFTQISSISVNISGLSHGIDVSGIDNLNTNVLNRTSGIPGIAASISGLNTSNLIAQGSSIFGQLSGRPTLDSVSGLPGIYLNTSGLAHSLDTSGIDNINTTILNRTSGIPGIAASISGLNTSNITAQCSSILAGVSGVPSGVGVIPTTSAASLISGTLAHDLRLMRRFSWGNLNIDKTYTPIRMYLEDDSGNMSSYFNLTDDANNTIRTKA